MNKFKKIFSKRSGFTLVEIIIAFVIFALMATMICQILNMVSLQRKSNIDFANEIDEQEQFLIINDKAEYDATKTDNGTLNFDFGDGTKLDVGYQMNGATPTGDVNGLAYFVSKEGKRDGDGGSSGSGDSEDPENSNTGAQTDRMNARITGTRGFEYVSVKVTKVPTNDSNGYVRYAFELCADATNMKADDVAYAMYRLYFFDKKGAPVEIAYANYLNYDGDILSGINNPGAKDKVGTNSQTYSPDPKNKYVVSLTGTNGIRIGTPWTSSGSGIRFTTGNKTRIEVVFKTVTDPEITAASFGENAQASGSACLYKANSTLSNKISTGPNIYGAYPKSK